MTKNRPGPSSIAGRIEPLGGGVTKVTKCDRVRIEIKGTVNVEPIVDAAVTSLVEAHMNKSKDQRS